MSAKTDSITVRKTATPDDWMREDVVNFFRPADRRAGAASMTFVEIFSVHS